MHLTFPRARVDRLLAHTRAAKEHIALYDDPKTARPGLWLVGDDGVYLLSNGIPRLGPDPAEGTPDLRSYVAYADQVNPKTMAFDLWWTAKRESFGGDDGAEFLDIDAIDRALATSVTGAPLVLDVSPKQIAYVGGVHRGPNGQWTWPPAAPETG